MSGWGYWCSKGGDKALRASGFKLNALLGPLEFPDEGISGMFSREKPRVPLSCSAQVLWILGGCGSLVHVAKAHGLLATALGVLRNEHDTEFACAFTQGLPGWCWQVAGSQEVPGGVILHVLDRLLRDQGAPRGYCPAPKISGTPRHHRGDLKCQLHPRARDQIPAFFTSRRSVIMCGAGLGDCKHSTDLS